ncbi:hypothetical protein BH11PAT2_BH11PAT2_03370 [soil metagenome]
MDTEQTSTSPNVNDATEKKGQSPWGVLIAILLILGIVVSGAYYALSQRIAPAPAAVDYSSSY